MSTLNLVLYAIAHTLFQIERRLSKYFARAWIRTLSTKKDEILSAGRKGNRKSIYDIGLSQTTIAEIEVAARASREVVLAKIDQDGLFLPNFALFPGVPEVSASDFVPLTSSQFSTSL